MEKRNCQPKGRVVQGRSGYQPPRYMRRTVVVKKVGEAE